MIAFTHLTPLEFRCYLLIPLVVLAVSVAIARMKNRQRSRVATSAPVEARTGGPAGQA
jgi:hypothetical protein